MSILSANPPTTQNKQNFWGKNLRKTKIPSAVAYLPQMIFRYSLTSAKIGIQVQIFARFDKHEHKVRNEQAGGFVRRLRKIIFLIAMTL